METQAIKISKTNIPVMITVLFDMIATTPSILPRRTFVSKSGRKDARKTISCKLRNNS